MRDFKTLQVWQKTHLLTLDLYSATKGFPPDERFGLTSQLRRAVISVESNIAEGCGRRSERELANFLSMAAGSASEIECQILVAFDLEYLPEGMWHSLNTQVNEVKKMLGAFIRTLEDELTAKG